MDPLLLLLIGVVVVIAAIVWLRLHAFVALFSAACLVAALTPRANIERAVLAQGLPQAQATARAEESLGVKLAAKFGQTCGSLGLLVAMASIIGAGLLRSGGADRIVRSMLRQFGEHRAPLVFAASGLLLGIPVFFDTVFLLLIPLARATGRRTRRNYLLYVLAIVVGGTMTHSLVPPTPGPLYVATALQVDMGLMIIGGLIVSTFCASCGLGYAWWANRRWPLELRELAGDVPPATTGAGETETPAMVGDNLPPLWLALLPIALPVVLISGATIMDVAALPAAFRPVVATLGHANVALALGAAIALITVATRKSPTADVRTTIQSALLDAGVIILITGAGGVFGGVLQETGVGERVQGLAHAYRIGVLPLAFLVTALMRTAQGSATVAMVTAVGIVGAFASPATLGFHPVYLALVIGCGSKLIPWMNDSGFWVMSKMSGMTERETLRTVTVMVSMMGVVGFLVIMFAAAFFPLV
ncbi:MAG: SLC13 family permease [Opitutaceae bacterium]|nr:SLC13 family permease [Opitutaceae bacterium]